MWRPDMKSVEQIHQEVREQVTKEWTKTGPIDEFLGIFMDQEISNRIALELKKQQQSVKEESKN